MTKRKNIGFRRGDGTKVKLFDNTDMAPRATSSRRVAFLISGALAIILPLMAAMLTTNSYLITSLNVSAMVCIFISIRFYGKEQSMYKAAICSYLMTSLFYMLITGIIINQIVFVLVAILIILVCIYLAKKFLTYIWNYIGDY
jgi:hypothetical protein